MCARSQSDPRYFPRSAELASKPPLARTMAGAVISSGGAPSCSTRTPTTAPLRTMRPVDRAVGPQGDPRVSGGARVGVDHRFTAACRPDGQATPEPEVATGLVSLPFVHQPPANALSLHPVGCVARLADEDVGELRVAPITGDPSHVGAIVLGGVRRQFDRSLGWFEERIQVGEPRVRQSETHPP